VAKPEWGTKRQCPACGGRFYDLGKADPVVCIKCEHAFEPEVLLKPRRVRPDDKPIADIKAVSPDDIEDDLEDDPETVSLEDLDEADVDEDDDIAAVADIPDIEIDDLDDEVDGDDNTLLETDDDDDIVILPKPGTDD
ncbi:unnamed protein product, partial [Phaeothamnion confervicola]